MESGSYLIWLFKKDAPCGKARLARRADDVEYTP